VSTKQRIGPVLGPATKAFFTRTLEILSGSSIPFLVGGGYALKGHTGLERYAHDLDVFVRPRDAERVLALFQSLGHPTELTFPHWLGKIYRGRAYVDVIFSSGNGVSVVDDHWFEHATDDVVFGQKVKLVPPEEMIWSKAFVMERERFDGADVIHIILACGRNLDWPRLLQRFKAHRIVLLSHLQLFLFVYPSENERIPAWVWEELLSDLALERRASYRAPRICRGTLLSREQYLDALERGYKDARLPPDGTMMPRDVVTWTKAAQEGNKAP